jgi:hypothetical protein
MKTHRIEPHLKASRNLTIAALCVAASVTGSFAAPVDLDGRSYDDGRTDADLRVEAFLQDAEVVQVEDLDEGITRPQRLTLHRGPAYGRAVFKTIDEFSVDPHYTSLAESTFSDRYVFEVAAYRMDRLLGIGLVPPTVLRDVDGREGSAQWWIEDAIDVQEAADHGYATRDSSRYYRNQMAMVVLDALIANIDRNPTNVLRTPGDDGFHLIDHSRAFRPRKTLPPWDDLWTHPVDRDLAERVRNLNEPVLTAVLGDLLSRKQIRAILKRRDRLVDKLDSMGLLPGTDRITEVNVVETVHR